MSAVSCSSTLHSRPYESMTACLFPGLTSCCLITENRSSSSGQLHQNLVSFVLLTICELKRDAAYSIWVWRRCNGIEAGIVVVVVAIVKASQVVESSVRIALAVF